MLQVDAWSKAAECERAIGIVADPERRVVLSSLRDVWIRIGNKQSVLRAPNKLSQISTIAQIHTELMSGCKDAMH